ncbi:MAG: hypothetical protein HN919_19530 [Verrucomicrobia bacterium]|jgi:hypothetical protein|nr:hypothetical protein [Verrucomicrobiota bacterium]MBT7068495.1 hypothetical protein [Verrucomicrobiota bacterium]MBT7699816.1 hypothetical protein [Verrucomicrobiota bacterium]
MSRYHLFMQTLTCAAVLTMTALPSTAQDAPSTIEAVVINPDTQTPIAIGGPWPWADQAWSIPFVPMGIELELLVTVRDAEGDPVFLAEQIGFIINPAQVGPIASLDLFAVTGGIHLMSGPQADLGVVPLIPAVGVAELIVDIKPGSDANPVNVNSRGVLPVALVATETIDPTLLDPASFVLDDIPPLRWQWADVSSPDHTGPDGLIDLLFFFDSVEVGAALADLPDGTVTAMALEGLIAESQLGAGGDSVRIIATRGRKPRRQNGRTTRPKK